MELITILIIVLAVIGASLTAALIAVRSSSRRTSEEAERLATLEAVRAVLAEQGDRITQAVGTLVELADDKLGSHLREGSRELEGHKSVIERAIAEQRRELERVAGLVSDLRNERATQHGQLLNGLEQAMQQSRLLASTTQQLRDALASPKARGQWGERMADDVLRLAGMVEGINYRKQHQMPGGGVPDVTFMLPDGLAMNMDVKFPVDNYLRFLEADTDQERQRARDAFLRDVRGRIKEVTDRGYIDPDITVGFMLLFIPNESVYSFIHEHDPSIADEALAQRVILCSPFTLFAVVAVVRQAVECFRLERRSDEILAVLGGFNKEWEKFTDKLERLGRNLTTVQNSYDELAHTRRRQLERKLDRVEALRTAELDPGSTDGEGEVVSLRQLGTG